MIEWTRMVNGQANGERAREKLMRGQRMRNKGQANKETK